jgi:hypothetical protein
MMRKLFIFFFLAVFSFSVYGQDSRAYQSRWQTRFLAGANIPITGLLQGAETDYLLVYDDNSFSWQVLSLTYFFHQRWGVDFSFQHLTSSSSQLRRIRDDSFAASIQARVGENYYVLDARAALDRVFLNDFARGFLGIVYRFETGRFYAYPRFAIGLTRFHTDVGSADLKRKNSNITYRLHYTSNEVFAHNFTLAPSISFGYKLTNRLFLNADIMFSYFRPNIVYEKTRTNLFTNRSTVERFNYRRGVSSLSLGAGLIFVIR